MPTKHNPNYWVQLSNYTANIDVIANLPEHTSVAANSSYDSPSGTASSIGGYLGLGNKSSLVATAAGADAIFQNYTKKIWRGTSCIEFTLQLLFDAEQNSKEDVHNNYCKLFALVLPDTGGVFTAQAALGGDIGAAIGSLINNFLPGNILYPPNPTRADSSYNQLEVRIGRQFYFKSCDVLSVNLTSEHRLNTGFPIAGSIDITLSTDYVYAKQDWYEACGLNNSDGLAVPGSTSATVQSVINRVKG